MTSRRRGTNKFQHGGKRWLLLLISASERHVAANCVYCTEFLLLAHRATLNIHTKYYFIAKP